MPRILNIDQYYLNLDQLELFARDYEVFKEMVNMPYGMILVSGLTGSGETTTLYSTLKSLDVSGQNIVTIEDPVEYALEDVSRFKSNPFDSAVAHRSHCTAACEDLMPKMQSKISTRRSRAFGLWHRWTS